MITSSGAEGITLKNVRYVHIMEPYWHPVRQEQIIGRAVRICSHEGLPDNLKNVKVFVYLMKFSDIQLNGDPNGKTESEKKTKLSPECRKFDISKKYKKGEDTDLKYITTDQSLHEISQIKDEINKSILKLIKESSIDCQIHRKHSDSTEVLQCYNYNAKDSKETFTFNPDISKDQNDVMAKKNQRKKREIKAKKMTLKGKEYLYIENPKLTRQKRVDKKYKRILDGDLYFPGEPLSYYKSIRTDTKTNQVKLKVKNKKDLYKF